LAQAIGRWGNYFNQEVYGREVTNPSLQFFPFSVLIEADGKWHYAFFLYEGVLNAIWFAVLFTIAWKLVKKPNGFITGLFCLFYGIIRAVMEPLRDTQFQYGNGEAIDPSLISSYLLIAIGVGLIAFVLIYNYKKEGKIFGSAKGDEYTVTNFVPSEKGELPLYTKINAATKLRKEGKIKA
jgi:phosphatidylglycerol:prolipoprotein diacylglycerol transferase